MTSSFLRTLVADMREHGETHAVIDDAGQRVAVEYVPRRPRDSERVHARFRLHDLAQDQHPALN